jgi:hypothetical protein
MNVKTGGTVVAPGSARTLLDLAIVFGIILTQAAINDYWMYSPIGWLDPWYYVGYAINYLNPTFLNDYYKLSRLPWVLAEFSARNLLGPVAASWTLQLSTLALAIASIYRLLHITLDRNAAFIGAALFASYMFGHASGGADYHNALAGPLFMLTWYLAVSAAQAAEGSYSRLLAAGVCAALTVHTNIVFVNLAPVIALHYLYTFRAAHGRWPNLVRDGTLVLVGAVLVTVALGLVNKSVGRNFLFFRAQLSLVKSFVADSTQQVPYWNPWSSRWYLNARYLGPWLAALPVSAATLAWMLYRYRPLSVYQGHICVYLASFCFAGAFWTFWQAMGHTALDWFYFAYPLVFPFCAVIAALTAYWAATEKMNTWLVRLLVPLFFLLPFVKFQQFVAPYYPHSLPNGGFMNFPIGASFAFTLVAIAIVVLSGRFAVGKLAGLVASALAIGIAMDPYFSVPSSCRPARDASVLIEDVHRHIRTRIMLDVHVWADDGSLDASPDACRDGQPKVLLRDFGHSLISTGFSYLEHFSKANSVQGISSERLDAISRHPTTVVYLTRDEERASGLMERLRQHADVHPLNHREFRAGAHGISVYTFQTRPRS